MEVEGVGQGQEPLKPASEFPESQSLGTKQTVQSVTMFGSSPGQWSRLLSLFRNQTHTKLWLKGGFSHKCSQDLNLENESVKS